MGMMVRRNMKQRADKKTAPVIVPQKDNAFDETLTKTEIFRMSTANLRELAKKNSIDDADTLTGGVLKKRLIEHFKL